MLFMNHYVYSFELSDEDVRVLDEYIRLNDIRNSDGNLVSRSQACFSIIKEFVDSVKPMMRLVKVPCETEVEKDGEQHKERETGREGSSQVTD